MHHAKDPQLFSFQIDGEEDDWKQLQELNVMEKISTLGLPLIPILMQPSPLEDCNSKKQQDLYSPLQKFSSLNLGRSGSKSWACIVWK